MSGMWNLREGSDTGEKHAATSTRQTERSNGRRERQA
jgi:hypothetical protein